MSGLEALSLVCSIMQVISFTKEVLTLCKDVYDGRPTTDGQMEENTASIKVLLDEMRRCSGPIQQQAKDEKELQAVAQKCSKAAQELQKEMQQITKYNKPGHFKEAIISGFKYMTHKKKVASLHDRFSQCQKTLETHLLIRLCTKSDAIKLQQREDFINLSDTMKRFISQLAAGHTKMDDLIAHVTHDGSQTRQQIQQSEARVKQSINDVHNEKDNETKRSRLLRSLKYDSMNARRTELKPAHEATYVSIFESLEADEESVETLFSSSAAAWRNFVQWLQSDEQVFWIQGKPGAGKSTLVKFLLQHKNTQRGLDKWSSNTLIVSHFFWKPGEILQRNFRGMLCSLNHQLLSSDHNLIEHVLSQQMFARHNDAIGDWEISQLKSMLHSTLTQCKRSVLFLIDGLDEANETDDILQLIDALIQLRNIKLCISSRSEDIFLQRFSKYNGFKLNDLTWDDMLQFASAGLPAPDDRYSSDFLTELKYQLVEKAEGVYLWLVIALESVKRGLQNNDEQHEIRLRLSKLPSKLEELYADMWGRLGEDKDIYQKCAARYFSLLIANQSLLEEYSSGTGGFNWNLSPFQIMLTTNMKMKKNILDKSYRLPVSEINQKCLDAIKGISIETAGLLVTQDASVGYSTLRAEVKPEFSQLKQHLESKVVSIHRTLLDFFKDTEVGKSILAQGQTNCIDAELATIILCQLRTLRYGKNLVETLGRLYHGTSLHYLWWILARGLKQDSAATINTYTAVLNAFENLFGAGLLPWDLRPEWYPLPCFDTLLFIDPVCKGLIQSRVEGRDASHVSGLLREFMIVRDFQHWHIPDKEEYIRSLGDNIISPDIYLYDSPTLFRHVNIYGTIVPEFITYESVLSGAIKSLYSVENMVERLLHESMQILVACLEQAPNLNDYTSFLLCAIDGDHVYPQRRIQLADLLFTITSVAGDGVKKLSIDQGLRIATGGYYAFIIAEVNLKHLVGHFLKVVSPKSNDTMSLVTRARQLTELESSKPHVKARFFIEMSCNDFEGFTSMVCRRFINQDVDVLAEGITKETLYNPSQFITRKKIGDYRNQLEEVDFSTLSVLADEKLGICRLEDMGIKPPS